jgi:hypothetical protein
LFPHQNPVWTSPRHHTCHMPSPTHSSWFDHLDNFTHSPVISSLLAPNIFLSTAFLLTIRNTHHRSSGRSQQPARHYTWQTDRRTDRQTDGQTDRRTDRQTVRRILPYRQNSNRK